MADGFQIPINFPKEPRDFILELGRAWKNALENAGFLACMQLLVVALSVV